MYNKSDEKYQFFTTLIQKRALLSVLLTLVTFLLWDQVEGDTGYRGGPCLLRLSSNTSFCTGLHWSVKGKTPTLASALV